ncbi:MAG: TIGR03808 family TAT-translocated repetitive protein [Hyphomicrobiales bacterium]|nr:TIGR03808 family TAT-translocated repetitive protein [Hyphomicrobiales bacterium]
MNRRHLLTLGAGAAGAVAASAIHTAPMAAPSALGIDATLLGVRPGQPDDQSRAMQRAVDETARMRAPLVLAPGVYRVGNLKLPAGAQLVGTRGATRLELGDGSSLISASAAETLGLTGLVLDGGRRQLPERRGLVHLESCGAVRIEDCEIRGSGRNGIVCIAVDGEITGTSILDSADVAIHALDSRGLTLARNRIDGAGNNGIQVWRGRSGDDGTIVIDNRIDNIANRSGGSGQYGNGVNVFRAANVLVRGNRIRNCAFSAVRGNAASNIHMEANSIGAVREVALYAEFGFEGALIANNTVDGAAIGISVTNFNEGGRLAVVQGNIIRNLVNRRPVGTDAGDGAGIGIAVEADTAVTGNVVENAPTAGIMLGFGQYLRDVAATGNVVRKADIGVAVSVAPGAGSALIANNMIAETRRGAIVGMLRGQPVTGDLTKGGGEQYAHLVLSGNRAR